MQRIFGNSFLKKLLVALLSMVLCITVLPFGRNAVKAEGASWTMNVQSFDDATPALNGWMYYFADGGTFLSDTDSAYVDAVAEGRTGNALHVCRKSGAPNEVVLYSNLFEIKASKQYKLSAYVKVSGSADSIIGIAHKEVDAENEEIVPGRAAEKIVTGDTAGEWKLIETVFTTDAAAVKAGVKFLVNSGVGDFYIDDISVQEIIDGEPVVSPSYNWAYSGWGIGTSDMGTGSVAENQTWNLMTDANISSESSDKDDASLNLTNGTFAKTVFAPLPPDDATYTLSFKYKGSGGRLSIRMDNYNLNGERLYYVDGANGDHADWTEFTYDFKVNGSGGVLEVSYLAIGAVDGGNYLVDELSIVRKTEKDKMQYIQNGSFGQNYDFHGNYLSTVPGMRNIAMQPDGSFAIALGNQGVNTSNWASVSGGAGFFVIPTAELDKSQKYILSYEYRGGAWETSSAHSPYGTVIVSATKAGGPLDALHQSWRTATSGEVDLAHEIQIYGDVGPTAMTYIRNISLKGATDGKEYFTAPTLIDLYENVGDITYGENIFTYGTFDGSITPETDWVLEGGATIRGKTFEDGVKEYKLVLDGQGVATAPAQTIDAAADNTFAKVYYSGEYEGKVSFSLKTNDGTILKPLDVLDPETIEKTEYSVVGQFAVPAGTTSLQLIIESESGFTSFENISIATHVHTFVTDGDAENPAIVDEATCSKGGSIQKYCSECGEYVKVSVTEKLEHDWTDWKVKEPATCLLPGVEARTCKIGGETETREIPATGHNYQDGVCVDCGAEDPEYQEPEPGEHVWSDWQVVKEATCTEAGQEKRTCSECGEEQVREIPAKGHHYVDGVCTECDAKDPDYQAPVTDKKDPKNNTAVIWGVVGGVAALAVIAVVVVFIVRKKRIK